MPTTRAKIQLNAGHGSGSNWPGSCELLFFVIRRIIFVISQKVRGFFLKVLTYIKPCQNPSFNFTSLAFFSFLSFSYMASRFQSISKPASTLLRSAMKKPNKPISPSLLRRPSQLFSRYLLFLLFLFFSIPLFPFLYIR